MSGTTHASRPPSPRCDGDAWTPWTNDEAWAATVCRRLALEDVAENCKRIYAQLRLRAKLTFAILQDTGATAGGRTVRWECLPDGSPGRDTWEGLIVHSDSTVRTFGVPPDEIVVLADQFPAIVAWPNLYLTLSIHKPAHSRTSDTCSKVLALVLDCDLGPWLAQQGRVLDPCDLPECEFAPLKELHRRAVVDGVRQAVGIEPSLWDSGHGCYALWLLRDGGPSFASDLHPRLVQHINEPAGWELADPQVVDCCSRLIRAPGAYHVKNPERPLQCRILREAPPTSLSDIKQALPAQRRLRRRGEATPETNHGLIPQDLVKAARGVSTASQLEDVLGACWPPGPSFRQALASEASASLWRLGCDEQTALDMITRVAVAAGDEEVTLRADAVRTTYGRIANGQRVRSLPVEGTRPAIPPVASTVLDRKDIVERKARVLLALVRLAYEQGTIDEIVASERVIAEMVLAHGRDEVRYAIKLIEKEGLVERYRRRVTRGWRWLAKLPVDIYKTRLAEARREHTLTDEAAHHLAELRARHAKERVQFAHVTKARTADDPPSGACPPAGSQCSFAIAPSPSAD